MMISVADPLGWMVGYLCWRSSTAIHLVLKETRRFAVSWLLCHSTASKKFCVLSSLKPPWKVIEVNETLRTGRPQCNPINSKSLIACVQPETNFIKEPGNLSKRKLSNSPSWRFAWWAFVWIAYGLMRHHAQSRDRPLRNFSQDEQTMSTLS